MEKFESFSEKKRTLQSESRAKSYARFKAGRPIGWNFPNEKRARLGKATSLLFPFFFVSPSFFFYIETSWWPCVWQDIRGDQNFPNEVDQD